MTAPTPEGLAEARAIVERWFGDQPWERLSIPSYAKPAKDLTEAIAAALERERAGRVAAERERDEWHAEQQKTLTEWRREWDRANALETRAAALADALRALVDATEGVRLGSKYMAREHARTLLPPPAPPGARA